MVIVPGEGGSRIDTLLVVVRGAVEKPLDHWATYAMNRKPTIVMAYMAKERKDWMCEYKSKSQGRQLRY